ncbi:hypothetical protein [Sphingomonas sp.]|uniref:hypothetical protein n=1 Tax=Sphingomonas sp. TaxID=28214 RepID=UPI0031D7F3CB
MRRTRFRAIVIPLGLIAVPAFASQNQNELPGDCYDVAAPMAEAMPCLEAGREKHAHRIRHGQNPSKRDDGKTIPQAGDEPATAKSPR